MSKKPKNIERPKPSWLGKFTNAFRGLAVGIRGQNSYPVHLAIGAAVLIAAGVFRVAAWEWCLLVLCIALVLAAELFNTALERVSRAVTHEHNPMIRDALDISAAAVLITSLGATVVGLFVFVPRFWVG